MNKNLLLRIALACGKIFIGLLLLMLLGFSIVFVHYHLRPGKYKDVIAFIDREEVRFSKKSERVLPSTDDVANKRTTGFQVEMPSSIGQEIYKGRQLPLQDISAFSLYILSFQFVAATVLLLLIVHELLNVIRAVQSVQTFQASTVLSFRKIGFLCLAIALLNGFYFFDAEGISRMGFSVQVNTLLCMLGAFVLSEVFKEGNKLFEQDQLTI